MASNLNKSYLDLEQKVTERTYALELSNTDLKRKKEIDSVYKEIGAIMNSTMKTEELLSKSLARIVSFTDSQVGIIYLYDETEQCLRAGACYAIGNADIKLENLALGIGIPGQAAVNREPILIRNIPEDTIFKIKHGMGDSIPRNIGSFPILLRERLLGVLVLASLKEYPDEVPSFINNINSQLAIAISNTQAFELVQAQAERLKRQESELMEKETRLRTILNNTVDAIITIDERGAIESFNQAAERIFGYTAAETIGKNVKMLQPEPYHSRHDEYLSNYLRTGEAKIIGIGREVTGLRKRRHNLPS